MQISIENYIEHHCPQITQSPRVLKQLLFSGLKKFFHEDQINIFLQENTQKDAFSFIEATIDYFDISIGLKKEELRHIPTYGRVVIIANHPLGALDAMALMHLLKDIRSDIKIVANDFLLGLENLRDVLIPVDNITGGMNRETIRSIYHALEEEQAVIIFPSGEVSRARPSGIKDTSWKSGFLKIATKMKAPILPVYIKAKNSNHFYILSMLNRSLATITLPHEMFKAKGKKIEFTIGKSIPFDAYHLPSLGDNNVVKLLRKHFYRVAKHKKPLFKTQNEISIPESRSELKAELKCGKILGETFDDKKIILYESPIENCILKEIGRLREVSFRHVGEGSGKKRDLDEYDYYYKHLIIWDDEALEIAGAYRLGESREIIEEFDTEGLYTKSLFDFDENFLLYLGRGLELGRSFVQPKYWNSRALDYLWQGIGAYVKQNPQIRYLFGAVSLSNAFNDKAKALIIYFFQQYFGSSEKLVAHKVSYSIPSELKAYCENLFAGDNYREDQRRLKEELSLMGYAIPTLYKQYAEVCEEGGVKFLDFGYDKDFNNCIDGLIVVDLNYLKPSKAERYFR
jgi:putative hemolysin